MEEIAKAVLTGKPVKDLPVGDEVTTFGEWPTVKFKEEHIINSPKKSLGQMVFELGTIDALISDLDEFDQDLDFLFKAQYADIEEKCEAYHAFLKGVFYKWRDTKEEIEALKKREKALSALHERVSSNLKDLMEKNPNVNFQGKADKEGKRKIVFALRKAPKSFKFDYEIKDKSFSNYIPDHVVQLDPRVEKFCVNHTVRVLSKAAIAKALDDGVEVPFAAFEQGYYVSGIPKLKIEKDKKEE